MRIEDDPASPAGRPRALPGVLSRLLAALASALLLGLALMFSVLVFALLAAAGLLVWGFLWWKMRGLRRQVEAQMKTQMADSPPGGRVIEGEVIRASVTREEIER